MDLAIIIPTILIIIGAIVMALNIVRSLSTLKMFYHFIREDTEKVKSLFRMHEILMVFFLIGYIVVAYATIAQVKLISSLFVGVIFFFGALFVQLGIMLQTKMISSIKKQYDSVVSIRENLQEEKKNLKEANQKLVEEINWRQKAQEEQKRLEKKLVHSQKMEALGLLAGGVAHDLNNVLSGIVSYPDLLLMDLEEDSPLRKPILTMKRSGERAATIVQDLLTLARRGVAVEEVVSLNEIIEEYLKSPEFKKLESFHSNIDLEINLDAKLLNILGSTVHLTKMLMNLVSNAVEAMPEGGKVTIATENRYVDMPIGKHETVAEGDYVVLTVSDNGMGILQEDLDKVFEPFYTKKVMGRSGTGLGMTVVWGTVKDHNGYIDVQSIEGKGTIFTIYLPVTRMEFEKDKVPSGTEYYMGNKESILVVDDMEEQQEIASAILTKLNYSVVSVSSGEEAINYLKGNKMDLLLLDMIMDPGINGLDTFRKVLKIHPKQKAIIASGYTESGFFKELHKLGVKKYIKKPYTLEKIGIAVGEELKK